jgi:hypothetical protein
MLIDAHALAWRKATASVSAPIAHASGARALAGSDRLARQLPSLS